MQRAIQSSLRNGMHSSYTAILILWEYLRDSVLQKDTWRRKGDARGHSPLLPYLSKARLWDARSRAKFNVPQHNRDH